MYNIHRMLSFLCRTTLPRDTNTLTKAVLRILGSKVIIRSIRFRRCGVGNPKKRKKPKLLREIS